MINIRGGSVLLLSLLLYGNVFGDELTSVKEVYTSKVSSLENRQVKSAGGYLFTKVSLSKKSKAIKVNPSAVAELYGKRNYLDYSRSVIKWDHNISKSSQKIILETYKSINRTEGSLRQMIFVDRKEDKSAIHYDYAIQPKHIRVKKITQAMMVQSINQAVLRKESSLNVLASVELSLRHPKLFSLKPAVVALVDRYGNGVLNSLAGNSVADISILSHRDAIKLNSEPSLLFKQLDLHPFNPDLLLSISEYLLKKNYHELAKKTIGNSFKIQKNSPALPRLQNISNEMSVKPNSFFNITYISQAIDVLEIEVFNSGLSLSDESDIIVYSFGEAPFKKSLLKKRSIPSGSDNLDEQQFEQRFYELQKELKYDVSVNTINKMGFLLLDKGFTNMGLSFIHQSLTMEENNAVRAMFNKYKTNNRFFNLSKI